MEEDLENDYNFPLIVSEVVKLIEERITKSTFKFTHDESEESPDQDFYLRFNCIQGWFIRCSFTTKVVFLKKCAMKVNDINLLITIINTLYTISSKDRLYSLAGGTFQAADMKLLAADNRCLHNVTLEKVMNNEINWFKNLSNNKQYLLLMKLISFADGLVIMNNIFTHFIDVLSIRSKESRSLKSSVLSNIKRSKVSSIYTTEKNEKLREAIQYCFHKIIPPETTDSITSTELNALLLKWKQFMFRYSEQIYTPQNETLNDEENFSTNVNKPDIAMDIIQKHPIWVTMSILRNLDNPQNLGKLNDYWATTMKEFKGEIAARKLLDKDIALLEDQIKTMNFNKKVKAKQPELRNTASVITKPSLRNKFKTKNIGTHFSLISEVYKDYLVDFNLNSKKIQSFPRPMNLNKTKTCNI